MPLIVQKFGGTSVADSQKILAAARKAIRAQQEGNQVVMVVSAMGHNTDLLIDLAGQITDQPPAREMDMLLSTGEQVSVALMAMAIHSLGHKAISLTGAQIGIKTDSTHTKARIQSISTDRMRKALDEGKIVIAAGFQGIDEDFNITTLGRGGSDTTAVALAAVLRADACEIYTDVDGVYTTDPRIVPEARQVKQRQLRRDARAGQPGAGVMHNRSIEFAKKFSVPIHVRSSFSDEPGTMIVGRARSGRTSRSAARRWSKNEARVTVLGVPDRPGTSLAIFSKIAGQEHLGRHDRAERRRPTAWPTSRSPCCSDDLPATLEAVDEAADGTGRRRRRPRRQRVEGLGRRPGHGHADRRGPADVPRPGRRGHQHPDDHHQRDQNLGAGRPATRRQQALRTVHQAFELDRSRRRRGRVDARAAGARAARSDAAAVVARLQKHGRADDRRHRARRDRRPASRSAACPTSRASPPRSSTTWPTAASSST